MAKRRSDPCVCGVCMTQIVRPQVPSGAQVMVFGEHPGQNEMEQGIPFAPSRKSWGKSTGDVLRAELYRVGVMPNQVIMTNLWLHPMPSKKEDRDNEIEWHIGQLLGIMGKVKAVLMLGDECTHAFLDSIMGPISSLEVKVSRFPASVETITVGPNPAGVFHGAIGEIRLAIEKFSRRAEPWL